MIPRRFFWLFDLLVLGVAFLAAYSLVPRLAPLFAPGGPLRTPWLETWVSPALWSGQLPPLAELLWIFLVMAPSTLLILGVLGNYGPLLFQSRTRIVAGSFAAPLASLSLAGQVLLAGDRWLGCRVGRFSHVRGVAACESHARNHAAIFRPGQDARLGRWGQRGGVKQNDRTSFASCQTDLSAV